jgi:imidazolonepropionase-like amidohydrolase
MTSTISSGVARGAAALALLAALAAAGCSGRPAVSPPASGPRGAAADRGGEVWIRDVTVISPERAQPLRQAQVVLRGGRIASVGLERPRDLGPGATVVEGAGRFLVPGLIDGHVHLAEVPGVSHEQLDATPGAFEGYFQQLPRSYLYFGFTAVVDLNVIDRERLRQIRASELGPEIFDCGGGLALANGYPMSFAPPERRFELFSNYLHDARQVEATPAGHAPAEHTPAAAVGRVAAGGGVCVKAFYEPGFGAQRGKLPILPLELAREVRAESHARRLPLLLHANSLAAHRFAVDAGVDAVVHGLWNWGPQADADGALPDPVARVLDDEVRAGVGMMPTSRVISGLEALFDPGFLDDPQLARVLPAGLLAWYRSEPGRWFAREIARGYEGMPAERVRQGFRRTGDAGRAAAAYFARRGGRLLFGSDTPSGPTYANPPGYNGHLEMRELERAGVAPRQIFEAATRANAAFFGLAADYGTVEPGKRASLLLLRADPLASVAAFDAIESVIVAGRVVPRAELAAR